MKRWIFVHLLLILSGLVAACGAATAATETESNPAPTLPICWPSGNAATPCACGFGLG